MLKVDFDWVVEFIQERISGYHWYEGGQEWPDETLKNLLEYMREEYNNRIKSNELKRHEELQLLLDT